MMVLQAHEAPKAKQDEQGTNEGNEVGEDDEVDEEFLPTQR
jgi:hypothetical protein